MYCCRHKIKITCEYQNVGYLDAGPWCYISVVLVHEGKRSSRSNKCSHQNEAAKAKLEVETLDSIAHHPPTKIKNIHGGHGENCTGDDVSLFTSFCLHWKQNITILVISNHHSRNLWAPRRREWITVFVQIWHVLRTKSQSAWLKTTADSL